MPRDLISERLKGAIHRFRQFAPAHYRLLPRLLKSTTIQDDFLVCNWRKKETSIIKIATFIK